MSSLIFLEKIFREKRNLTGTFTKSLRRRNKNSNEMKNGATSLYGTTRGGDEGKKTVWGKRQEKFWSTLENLRWKENNQIMWVMAVLSNHIHLWQNCWHKQKKRIVKEAKTFAIKKRRVFFVFATPTHRWRAYIKLENRVRSNSTTIHTSTSLVL